MLPLTDTHHKQQQQLCKYIAYSLVVIGLVYKAYPNGRWWGCTFLPRLRACAQIMQLVRGIGSCVQQLCKSCSSALAHGHVRYYHRHLSRCADASHMSNNMGTSNDRCACNVFSNNQLQTSALGISEADSMQMVGGSLSYLSQSLQSPLASAPSQLPPQPAHH